MVEKRREALETKVERWKWALERVYLTRVLTRIVRLVAAASGSRSPSPPKSVFQSPSNALHCGVFKRRFTAAQDQRDHRRPVIFWYLARGEGRMAKKTTEEKEEGVANTLLPSRIRGRGSWKFLSEREQRVVEMKGVAR